MTWHVPHSLGGPVLYWELLRGSRQLWPFLLRVAYAGWLFVYLAVLISQAPRELKSPERFRAEPPDRLELGAQRLRFFKEVVPQLLRQQLIVLLLLAPVVSAGALCAEKESGTLLALFTTGMRAGAIVAGKLLGRLWILAGVALIGLPPLVVLTATAGMAMVQVLCLLAQAVLITFAAVAACMLLSLWARRTGDAILGCYATALVLYLVCRALEGSLSLPMWLDPFEVIDQSCPPEDGDFSPGALGVHCLVWACAGLLCLALAAARLRRTSLRQAERLPSRWLWAFRPGIGRDPIRWREHHVLGLTPVPWLRMVPRWMARLGVLIFSCILIMTGSNRHTLLDFTSALSGDLTEVQDTLHWINPEHIQGDVIFMGIVFLLLGPLVVVVRCAGSIAEEKRRKTWEDLLLTPLTLDEIKRGKMWGVLEAALPYSALYMGPVIALSILGGIGAFLIAVVFLAGGCVLMFAAAVMGRDISI